MQKREDPNGRKFRLISGTNEEGKKGEKTGERKMTRFSPPLVESGEGEGLQADECNTVYMFSTTGVL